MYKNIFFKNHFVNKIENVLILDNEDEYTGNFAKQWKRYNNIQIDSLNNFKLSKEYLEELLFDNLDFLQNKNILEIGSGAGRFTEYISKYAKNCVSLDLSSSIFYNVAKNNNNITLIKANFINLIPNIKFDIVICRGVLQHTPNPTSYLLKLFEFIDNNGYVFFDIYPTPKLGLFHPKYLIWRPLIQNLITYDKYEIFLNKNIKILLKIKRFVKLLFFNSNFISDLLLPVWDYKDKYRLNEEQLENWAILDTLDGLYAKYDKPYSYKKIKNILKLNNITILKDNKNKNYFKTTIT